MFILRVAKQWQVRVSRTVGKERLIKETEIRIFEFVQLIVMMHSFELRIMAGERSDFV